MFSSSVLTFYVQNCHLVFNLLPTFTHETLTKPILVLLASTNL